MIKAVQQGQKQLGQELATGSLGSGWHSAIKVVQMWTSTRYRFLRVRAAQHNLSSATTDKLLGQMVRFQVVQALRVAKGLHLLRSKTRPLQILRPQMTIIYPEITGEIIWYT